MARLLVIDDDQPLARGVARSLRERGHDVQVTGSAAETRQLSGAFDLGVLDYDLTDGDGVSVAKELLAEGRVARAVIFSGNTDAEVIDAAKSVASFLPKQLGTAALAQLVDDLLSGTPT